MGDIVVFKGDKNADTDIDDLKRTIMEAIDCGDKMILAIKRQDGETGTGWCNCETAGIFELIGRLQMDAILDLLGD